MPACKVGGSPMQSVFAPAAPLTRISHPTHAPVVDLAHTPAEHDGLDPLPALAVGQALAIGAAVARDERLTKLVAIVAGTVGGID